MSISREDIEHLSKLARIALSEEEMERLGTDINNILGYVEQVAKAEVETGEQDVGGIYNVMREDVDPEETGIYTDDLLALAPNKAETEKGTYVKVPKIL